MLSAPVCRQAGWLNAECKLKNAKSPSVKLERQHVRTLKCQHVHTFTRSHVCTLELGIRNWELGISIFYFLFPVFYLLNCILQVCPQFHYIWLFHSLTISLLTDLMFWHLDIWISFDIWILKFGFFIFIKLLMA